MSITAGNFNVLANGGLIGGVVAGTGQSTLATIALDVDQLIVGSAALGQGISHDWGDIAYSLGYDIVDVSLGLDVDLRQKFTIDDDVTVMLQFDEEVTIEGLGNVTQYVGPIDAIPEITIHSDSVGVSAELLVEAELQNETEFAFVGSLNTTILEAHASIAWDILGNSGSRGYQFGPAYENTQELPLGDIDVYNDMFALGGFNTVNLGTFQLTAVPEPTSAGLLALASGLLLARRRR